MINKNKNFEEKQKASIDITKLQKASETQFDCEKKFKDIFNLINDGVTIINNKGDFLYANKRAYEISGYCINDLDKLTIYQLLHPEEVEKVRERIEKRFSCESVPVQYEFLCVYPEDLALLLESWP